jgi:hypothetical protein
MTTNIRLLGFSRVLIYTVLSFGICQAGPAAEYQWDFGGNLNQTFGNGVLAYANGSSQSQTSFNTTNGTTVPHINGQPAAYMHIPAFAATADGYLATFADTGPNGGGSFVNQYTMVFDVLEPGSLNWTPFFNTSTTNGNDADFYIAPDGAVGIGSDYSPIGSIVPNTWYRVAFTADLGANQFTIYIDGVQKHQHNGQIGGNNLIDSRWSLSSNLDAGHDLWLFNEGDGSGVYTHELYLNSFYFADRALSPNEIAALGGPNASGIVPEPAAAALVVLAMCGWCAAARRTR